MTDMHDALGNDAKIRMISYRELFRYHVDVKLLDDIRKVTIKGLALGIDQFIAYIATISPFWPWAEGEKFRLSDGRAFNRAWINEKIDQGYTIYDIGLDRNRKRRSSWYKLEREEIF